MFKIKLSFILINLLFFEKAYSNRSNIDFDSVFVKPKLWTVEDINGRTYSLKKKISVFIFLDVECPISQYYTRILQRIFLKYGNSKVVFFTIFPTKYTHKGDIISFNQKYVLKIPSVLDKFQSFTKKLNASITPEVFVVNQNNEIAYSGIIDDSYFALGKRNLNPTKFYLEDALTSIVKNNKPLISHSNAIGCEIQRIP